MTPRAKNWLIASAALVGIAGLVSYLTYQFFLLYDFAYFYKKSVLNKLGLDFVSITLYFDIDTKSDVGAYIYKQKYKVYVNGIPAASLVNTDRIPIKANGKSTFPIKVEFNPQDLVNAGLKNVNDLLFAKDKVIIKTVGTVDVQSGVVKIKNFPFEYSDTLASYLAPTPVPPTT